MAEPTLKKGAKGQAVKDLQQALKDIGITPGPGKVDGVFGKQTEDAVKAFQTVFGIEPDGIVGPVTWLNIDEADGSEPVLRNGSKGLPVRRLQKRMMLAGFAIPEVNGRFGPKTEAAVKALQKQAGIQVDGVVGPETWGIVDALESEREPVAGTD
jgi:peptidoglycan hydrolase-like protein with peptidoglycan-binding domain